jgi:hypothetical protein
VTVGSASASTQAPAPTPKKQAAVVTSSSSEFGLEGEALRLKREAENPEWPQTPQLLTARVKRVSERAHGEYLIELDNGQVWVETLRTGGIAPNTGDTVTIKSGSLGSFYLKGESGLALRVKRIQ